LRLLPIQGASFDPELHNRVKEKVGSEPMSMQSKDDMDSRIERFPPDNEPLAGAFWSLTVYTPDMFFCDNPYKRYSLGDRCGIGHRDCIATQKVSP